MYKEGVISQEQAHNSGRVPRARIDVSYRTREPPYGCARQGLPYRLGSEGPKGSAEVPGEADEAG